MTATATRPAAESVAVHSRQVREAEQLLLAEASGTSLTPEETSFVMMVFPTDQRLKDARRRTASVHRWRSMAGSAEEREAVDADLASIDADLERERAALAETQRRLASLETQRADLHKRQTNMARGLKELQGRMLLPEPEQIRLQQMQQRYRERFAELERAEGRIRAIDGINKILSQQVARDHEGRVHIGVSSPAKELLQQQRRWDPSRPLADQCRAFADELRVERGELERLVDAEADARDGARHEMDSILEYWIR